MRQGRRHPDPAHLPLLAHILQHPHQVAGLARIHRGIVVLHQVHVIRPQPSQAFVQPPESVFPRPDVVAAAGRASALGGEVEFGTASREMPADLLFGRPRPVQAVVVGGIQEIDPRVQYRVQQHPPAVVVEAAAQRGAEPEAGDFEAGAPQLGGWNGWCHVVFSVSCQVSVCAERDRAGHVCFNPPRLSSEMSANRARPLTGGLEGSALRLSPGVGGSSVRASDPSRTLLDLCLRFQRTTLYRCQVPFFPIHLPHSTGPP